jgi:hypothetical protein
MDKVSCRPATAYKASARTETMWPHRSLTRELRTTGRSNVGSPSQVTEPSTVETHGASLAGGLHDLLSDQRSVDQSK